MKKPRLGYQRIALTLNILGLLSFSDLKERVIFVKKPNKISLMNLIEDTK